MNTFTADLDTLRAWLQDRSHEGGISWSAAQEIARRKERRAIPDLIAILDECLVDPSACAEDRRCWGAAVTLGTLQAPEALERLRQLFRESHGGTRLYAAVALREFGDPRAAPDLVEFLESREGRSSESLEAARALAALGDPRAMPHLVELLADPDQLNVARHAAVALGQMGELALPVLDDVSRTEDGDVRSWVVVALEQIPGPNSTSAIAALLGDPDWQVRWQAVRVLGDRGALSAAPDIEAMQDDPDERVRKIVPTALRQLGSRRPPPPPEPRPGRHVFKLYADYSQFYLGDSAFDPDIDLWGDEAFARRLDVIEPGMIAVGTARYDYAPVVVDVLDSAPEDSEIAEWDHIVEASLAVPSGRVAIDGCLSYVPVGSSGHRSGAREASPHFNVTPGTYRVRVYYGGQETYDEDHYRLVMWPQEPYSPPRVLKNLPRPT